jgi:SNF2 family DNA or RNA helicase
MVGSVLDSLTPQHLVVTSYDLLRRIYLLSESVLSSLAQDRAAEALLPPSTLERYVFDTIIADEAHSMRNPFSELSKAVFSLQGRTRLALTGTPVQNKVEGLLGLIVCSSLSLILYLSLSLSIGSGRGSLEHYELCYAAVFR